MKLPSLFAHLWCAPLLAGLLASPAGAVTLGEIRVFSRLGEPLHATLPVRLDSGEVLEGKCLKLVPDRDGLGAAAISMSARVELRDNVGEIVIGTRQSIPEPILRFNLQVQCGYGFHSREYTVLLDPPELAPQPASAATSSSVAAALAESSAPLPPVARAQRERPNRPPAVASPKPLAPKVVDQHPQLRLSTDDAARTQAGPARATGGAFQLRLSADLDLSRLGKKLSANENRDLKHKLQAIESDDDMAEILRLRNQIQAMETQMLALRQKTIEVMGLENAAAVAAQAAPAAVPEPAAADSAASAVNPVAAVGGTLAPAEPMSANASEPLAQAQAAAALARPVGNSQLGSWTDYLIWALVAAVSLGFAYMMWLYRGQHAEAHGLPDIFDDKGHDTAARNIPISRKLVNRQGGDSEPSSPDSAEIVVPEKDRWAIEEAQILIAQGWREQAVNLLVEQIESNPYQLDIWLMLFEIHQKAGNREAFAVLAERFRSIAKGLPVWNTIRQMGAAMDPDNPLYAL